MHGKYLIFAVSIALGFGALIFWYYRKISLADLDRMQYCACGMAEVKFDSGSITMVRYMHDSVKPGDTVGHYKVLGDGSIEMEVLFNGKLSTHVHRVDNIGLLLMRGVLNPHL